MVLSVSGPFHSPLMVPAQQMMTPFLKQVEMNKPIVPVMSNVTAQAMTEPNDIKEKLIEQIISPVRWQEIVQNLVAQGVDNFIEVGAGRILSGLIKRIEPEAKINFINKVEDLDNLS